jgi:hypothetical protein
MKAMPAKKISPAQTADAYALLGVKPNDVLQSPQIRPLLKKLKGGWPQALIYLRYSDGAPARTFLRRYDNILYPEWVRRAVPVEAFCVAAKVSPIDLWEDIVAAYRRVNQQLASIAAAESHPDVVAAVIERANEGSDKATTHLLKHMQFLPQAKGAQVSVVTNVQATAQAAATLPAPPPEETIRRMTQRFNTEKPAQVLEGISAPDDRALPAMPEPAEFNAMAPARDPAYAERGDE